MSKLGVRAGAATAVASLAVAEHRADVVTLRPGRAPVDHATVPAPAEVARYRLRCALATARIPRPSWIPGEGRTVSHEGTAADVEVTDIEAAAGELFDVVERGKAVDFDAAVFLVDDGAEWIILQDDSGLVLVHGASRQRWSGLVRAGIIDSLA